MIPYADEGISLGFGDWLQEGDLICVNPTTVEPDWMPTGPWLGVVEHKSDGLWVARCIDFDGSAPTWSQRRSIAYYLAPGCQVKLIRRAGRAITSLTEIG